MRDGVNTFVNFFRRSLGIDITNDGIAIAGSRARAVAALRQAQGARLVAEPKAMFFPFDKPAGDDDKNVNAPVNMVADVLTKLVRDNQWQGRSCVVSIPPEDVCVRDVRLPLTTRSELKKIVAQDNFWKETLRLKTDEFLKSWTYRREHNNCHLVMAAVTSDKANAYIKSVKRSGLRLRRLVVALPGEREDGAAPQFIVFAGQEKAECLPRACMALALTLPVVAGLSHSAALRQSGQLSEVAHLNTFLTEEPIKLAAATRKLNKTAERNIAYIENLKRAAMRQTKGATVLNKLTSVLPEGVHLKRLRFDARAKAGRPLIRIKGLTHRIASVLVLVESLREVSGFASVNLLEAQLVPRLMSRGQKKTTRRQFQFLIECMTDGEAGERPERGRREE